MNTLSSPTYAPQALSPTLNERLGSLHARLLETVPAVDRIACALYDPAEDMLATFLSSTRSGHTLAGYRFRLADSPSLSRLAREGQWRNIDDIPGTLDREHVHSGWVVDEGYLSSFTVPLVDNGRFGGFIFFDSLQKAAFTPGIQRDLALYCNLINMTVASEFNAVRQLVATVQVARDLTHMRDFETGAHLERMSRISRLIAELVAPQRGRDDEFVQHILLFAPLHDIGKIAVPDRILLKPGKLDAAERAIMQTHVDKGVEMIDRILGDIGLAQGEDSRLLRNIVRFHHEYLDGSGYPAGLRGDDIPLEARIVTVADVFDAMTSMRPYKLAWPMEDALRELERMAAAGQVDAACVAALRQQAGAVKDIVRKFPDLSGA
jgi:HD-GYP domain-containing protein (c-di-GMP phosphodiesterase class II)